MKRAFICAGIFVFLGAKRFSFWTEVGRHTERQRPGNYEELNMAIRNHALMTAGRFP